MHSLDLTISLVLYKNPTTEIQNLLHCINKVKLTYKTFLIDNSPTGELKTLECNPNTVYIFNNRNIGYGAAHNIAIQNAGNSKYHLILNPDIIFSEGILEHLYEFMETNKDLGQLMPKVYYQNGELQRLCKLLPHPADLIGRRFFNFSKWMQQRNNTYELENFNYDKILDIPALSGCFMFTRTEVLQQVKGFDTRFFMYMEDFDLTRRITKISRTIFYPGASVIHGYAKGSYENSRLLKLHIISAIKYFNKWGWLFDKEREELNKKVLMQLK